MGKYGSSFNNRKTLGVRTLIVFFVILFFGHILGLLGCFALGLVSGPFGILSYWASKHRPNLVPVTFVAHVAVIVIAVGVYGYFLCFLVLAFLGPTGANAYWMLAACAITGNTPALQGARYVGARNQSVETMTTSEYGVYYAAKFGAIASFLAAGLWAYWIFTKAQAPPY